MTSVTRAAPLGGGQTASEAIHNLLRFVRLLGLRRHYLLATITVAGLLGAFYFATAPRVYKATASLMVTRTAPDPWNAPVAAENALDTSIPTFERLFSYSVVLQGALKRLGRRPSAARLDFAGLPSDKWEAALRENLRARSVRRTNIIELSYRSRSPAAAAAVLDAVVQSYLEFIDKNHRDISLEYVAILEQKRQEKEDELKQAQARLLEVQRRAGDLGIRAGANVVHPVVQRAIRLNEAFVSAQEKRLQLDALLATIRRTIAEGGDLVQHLMSFEPLVGRELLLGSLGLNPQYAEVAGQVEKQQLADRARLTMIREHLGPTHPEVVELEQTLANADSYLRDYQQKLGERLQAVRDGQLGPTLLAMVQERLLEARAHETELQQQYQFAEQEAIERNDRMAELQLLENNLHRLRNLHDTLLDRIANIDIRRDRADTRVAPLSEPQALEQPISPDIKLVVLLCLGGGLFSGTALVYVLDLLDDRFRTPEELKQQLGVPVLALIRPLAASAQAGADALVVHASPTAVESEPFRTLRTALVFASAYSNRLAITSAESGDGKTVILANLGASYAQAGKRTLLIDADMRRPGLTRLFGLRGVAGLSDTLRGSGDMGEEVRDRIRSTGVPHLDLLPCGPKSPDPLELLGGKRFPELLAWAEESYDQVLVDCPPVMAASDAAVIGRLVDGVLLVVQPTKNHRRLVTHAAESLMGVQARMVGVVINIVEERVGAGYYGDPYRYGHDASDRDEPGSDDASDRLDNTEEASPPDAPAIRRRRAA